MRWWSRRRTERIRIVRISPDTAEELLITVYRERRGGYLTMHPAPGSADPPPGVQWFGMVESPEGFGL